MFCFKKARCAIIILLLNSVFFVGQIQANNATRLQLEGWTAGYSPILYGEVINNAEVLQSFYQSRQHQPLWSSNDKLTDNATKLISLIANIENEALLPEDYHFAVLSSFTSGKLKANPRLIDVILTDAFISLANHLLVGKVDPAELTNEWQSSPRVNNVSLYLNQIANGESLDEVLTKLRPNHIRYYQLKDALAQLKTDKALVWDVIPPRPMIKSKVADSRMALVKSRLIYWQDLLPDQQDNEDALIEAIKQFQKRHGLETDGILGFDTITALNVSPKDRIKQLEVNIERWRWLAEDLGEKFIVVNIAAFDLKVIEHNVVVFEKPVIVGKSFRKTPVFSNKIKYLVFNPTWTVPAKLAKEDKLPEIKKDPDYLTRMGFSVFLGGDSNPLDFNSINWQSVTPKNFNYRLVQAPGPLNALGQVKFMFPNPHDVYLHDTPTKDLFKKAERAFSSGCIRVSDPIELAEFLLSGQKWDRSKIQQTLDLNKTESVYLKQPIPIHIEYWTAWVDSKGKLQFRNDIYERDEPVWQALNQTTNMVRTVK